MDNRLDWIDMVKGMGMVLVMLAHAPFPEYLTKEIYTFHMPLFFFLSGYVFNKTKYPNFGELLRKRIKSLIVPYLWLSLINYVFWVVFYRNIIHTTLTINVFKPLLGILYAVRGTEWTLHIGTLWFVTCLFFSQLLFYLICRTTDSKGLSYFLLIICSVLGYLYSLKIGERLPWSIDATLSATFFFGVGYYFKQNTWFESQRMVKFKWLIMFMIINLIFGYINIKIDMFKNTYGNYFLFHISAISGIMSSIIFIRMLNKLTILKFIGENSLLFLSFHQFVIYPVISIIFNFLGIHPISWMNQLFIGLSYTIITSVIMIPIVYLINHYLPFIIGKTSNKNLKEEVMVY